MSRAFFNRPALEAIHKQCLDLGERKSHDYGAVADAIGLGGVRGVIVRNLDKQLRCMSLTEAGFSPHVENESLRDTLMDQINYATYAISMLDGTWGKSAPDPRITAANEVAVHLEHALRLGDIEIKQGSALHDKIVTAAATEDLPF